MELRNFRIFIIKIVREGNRLQKHDINGRVLTTRKFTQTQLICFLLSLLAIWVLKKGFSDNFAGYTISFLGIFIGLFSTIIISMYDKRKTLVDGYDEKDLIDKSRILKAKNYLVQFTGLTSYSILLAIVLIILLFLVLQFKAFQENPWLLKPIDSLSEINFNSIKLFFRCIIICAHRFLVVYFLSTFFVITLFSVTSFFSFLLSEYNKLKLKQ